MVTDTDFFGSFRLSRVNNPQFGTLITHLLQGLEVNREGSSSVDFLHLILNLEQIQVICIKIYKVNIHLLLRFTPSVCACLHGLTSTN